MPNAGVSENWPAMVSYATMGDVVALENARREGRMDPGGVDFFGDGLAHVAAMKGQPKVIHWLLDHGVNINQANSRGLRPVHHAAQYGHADVIRVLRKARVDLNARDDVGWQASHHASANNRADAIIQLRKAGAILHEVDDAGNSPLHLAVTNRCIQAMDELFKGGVEVDRANAAGQTAAHLAAANDDVGAIRVLRKANADFGLKDGMGRTVMEIAMQSEGHAVAAELLTGEHGWLANIVRRVQGRNRTNPYVELADQVTGPAHNGEQPGSEQRGENQVRQQGQTPVLPRLRIPASPDPVAITR
jgi:Ankyrin repeats (many copies)